MGEHIKYSQLAKALYKQINASGAHTERNDATTVVPAVMSPQTHVTLKYIPGKGLIKGVILAPVAGNTKAEINESIATEKRRTLAVVRQRALDNASADIKNKGSKVLALKAAEEAVEQFKKDNPEFKDINLNRVVDTKDDEYYLHYLDNGELVRGNNGQFVTSPYYVKDFAENAADYAHMGVMAAGVAASLYPNPVVRKIGNSIVWGQTAADVHQDLRQGDYTSAVLNVGLMGGPWVANKLYRTWKPFRNTERALSMNYDALRNQRAESWWNYTSYLNQLSDNMARNVANPTREAMLAIQANLGKKYAPFEYDWSALPQARRDYAKNMANAVDNPLNSSDPIKPVLNFNTGKVNGGNKTLAEYQKAIEDIVGDNALVGGSVRLYGSGIGSGIPHDLELLTTKSRAEAVRESIGAEGAQYGQGNGFMLPLEGKSAVFNSDGGHRVEVQFIGEDANGNAVGQLAHNYYSRLYPEEYKALQKQWEEQGVKAIDGGKQFSTYDQPLPITSEELYQMLQKHPRVYDYLVALDNFNGYKGKQGFRHSQMLANPTLYNRLQQANMRAVTDNWEFIKLSPEDIKAAKRDYVLPDWMSDAQVENYVNQTMISNFMGVRGAFKTARARANGVTWDKNLENAALSSVVAPYNGQISGIGGNQLRYSSRAGVGSDVTAILNNRGSDIHSYQDYVDQIARDLKVNNLYSGASPEYKQFDAINKAVAAGSLSIAEGTKQTEELAKQLGIRGFRGGSYGESSIYYGALQQPTIGLKAYTSGMNSGPNNILEVGGIPRINYANSPFNEATDPRTVKEFMSEIPLHKVFYSYPYLKSTYRSPEWYTEIIPKTKEYRLYTSDAYKKAAAKYAEQRRNLGTSTEGLLSPIYNTQRTWNGINTSLPWITGFGVPTGFLIYNHANSYRPTITDADWRETNKEYYDEK